MPGHLRDFPKVPRARTPDRCSDGATVSAMSTRLVNKITGADREFPDRLAAMLIADKSSGWAKPSKRQSSKTAATDGDTEPGE